MKYRINKIETYISLDFEENTYEEYIKNYKNENNYILDENNIKLIKIHKFHFLVNNKVNIDYYKDIFLYLYCFNNNNITCISRDPKYITNLDRYNKDKNKWYFRNHVKTYYLDNNNILYKKIKKIRIIIMIVKYKQ